MASDYSPTNTAMDLFLRVSEHFIHQSQSIDVMLCSNTFGQTYQRLGSLALDLELGNAVQIFLNPDLVGVILG